jgi:polyribonucleotide nucleotidyltransferase
MNNEKTFSTEWLGRTLTIKTGKLALQADAAVTVQYGDTVIMATVVESKTERAGIDFFPLSVEFEERLYAAGIIKGSRWIKREGRPSDDSILTGRMVDRAIRPLFDDSSRKDVQVIITVLSVDQENDHDVISLVAASAALAISGIKWNGPISAVRVGRVNGELNLNPTYKDRETSDLDLIVSGTEHKVIMIEASANEVKEADMLKAIIAGQENLQAPIELIKKMKKEIGSVKEKKEKEKLFDQEQLTEAKSLAEAEKIASDWLNKNIKKFLFDKTYYTKGERKSAVTDIKINLDKFLFEKGIAHEYREKILFGLTTKMVEAEVTNAIINEGKRVDGRKLDEIRLLSAEVGVLPRNHGAGLFSRGETQVMSIVTLGSPGMEQMLEGLEGQGKKRYMHHYNFAPYCVGEAKPLRGAGRREIGHGALAEKALVPVLPAKEDFPYTIRVVSETLGSNGSSSMGSTCASTLALMDAGVPIKKAVAGIAIGLASNEDMSKWEVITDLQDLEDGNGGMDFKVTGTADGLTAIQLDTKTTGLTDEIIAKTLTQGRAALDQILGIIKEAISEPRAELSKYAPRIYTLNIKPERIGAVIGPGGKIINEIIAATGVAIDIEDTGLVMITGTDAEKCAEAVRRVKEIVHEFEAGEIYTGKVVRILDFGAFVELTPGQDGMVHVSELAPYRVGRPSDFINIGDMVTVKIKEVDDQGRINLTMKGLEENANLWKDEKGKQEGNGTFGGGRTPRSGDSRGRSGGRRF